MPVHSGLSALIHAATSQLGHLIHSDTSECSHHSPQTNGEGYASSSDGELRSTTPTWTPTIVPEEGKKLLFPEVLMTLLVDPENSDIITFLPDGKFFAVRVKAFTEDLLPRQFQLNSFEEFQEHMLAWGFVAISSEEEVTEATSNAAAGSSAIGITDSSIQVFRHPLFRRGATDDLKQMRYSPSHGKEGQTVCDSHMSTAPGRARIEFSLSDDSSTSAKRRLSPSHVDRDLEDISCKQRALSEGDGSGSHQMDNDQGGSESLNGSLNSSRRASRRSSADIRSKALAVTAAQLSLEDGYPTNTGASKAERRASLPLIDGGLDKATQTIVSDAIETLLFDESHTRETYLKHEKELSKSSLPGVVPISKQLFSPPMTMLSGNTIQHGSVAPSRENIASIGTASEASELATFHRGVDTRSTNHLTVSPSQLEAANALVKQAGLKGPVWPSDSSDLRPPTP